MLKRHSQQGDTLIEVLLAITIFSLVVVTSLTLMNQGTAAAQRSLEIATVRQQIDGQAEALRFMHDSYIGIYRSGITFNLSDGVSSPAEEWSKMMTQVNATRTTFRNASAFGRAACPTTPPATSFIINPRTVRFEPNQTFIKPATTWSQLEFNSSGALTASNGMWIEAVSSLPVAGQSNAGYVDFHIRACWYGPSTTTPMTTGTIVRLYEPRG